MLRESSMLLRAVSRSRLQRLSDPLPSAALHARVDRDRGARFDQRRKRTARIGGFSGLREASLVAAGNDSRGVDGGVDDLMASALDLVHRDCATHVEVLGWRSGSRQLTAERGYEAGG